ncbi:MAG: SEC-C metal-binding domain-containing protein, partial [Pseudomonadota bacterium]
QSALHLDLPVHDWAKEEGVANEEIRERIMAATEEAVAQKRQFAGDAQINYIEKQVLLQVLDLQWRQHLQQLDQLRSVIHLRGYGQRDPLNEFKEEAFKLFNSMLGELRLMVTRSLMGLRIESAPAQQPMQAAPQPSQVQETKLDPDTGVNEMDPDAPAQDIPQAEDDWSQTPRNAACPCGSGKKYKHCHGAIETESV